jgi:hypothetical protein
MGQSPGKRTTSDQNRATLARHWNDIIKELQDEAFINLRDAANVIGFHAFPLGWSWNEYELKYGNSRRPYERKLQNAIRLGIAHPDNPESAGASASQNAGHYRRASVRRKLGELLARRKVRLYIYDHNCRGRIASERETLDAALTLQIPASGVYDHPYSEHALIDAPDLLNYFKAADAPWKGRSGKHDWFVAERLVRDFMSIHGCAFSDQAIMSLCEKLYPHPDPDRPLDKSRYAQLTRELRREHEFSVEKIVP